MRAFVFLLILVNLLFLVWTQGYFGTSSDPDALRVQQQLLADQVKIVARDEAPAETSKTEKIAKVPDKKVADVCLLFSDLPVAEIVKFEAVLVDRFPVFKSERTMSTGSGSYWVFISPLASKQEADKKASELKKLSIPEFFVVQDAGPNRFAISLGIFSSKEAASDRLEQLRVKGVKSARIGERDVKPASGSLEIRGPEAQLDLLRQSLAEVLPERNPVLCRTQVPSAPVQ